MKLSFLCLFLALTYMGTSLAQNHEEAVDKSAVPPKEQIKDEESCDDLMKKHLQGLLQRDHNGILSLHYQLTMLKLAKKVVGDKNMTLEEYIKKDMARLRALDKQDPATLDDLDHVYSANASDDLKSVYQNINALKKSSGSLDYIAGKRIDNDDVASYILYETMLDTKDNTFNKTDVAVLWMMKNLKTKAAQTSAAGKASAAEVSNQVARYTGLVKGVDKASSGDINKELKSIKGKIDAFMMDARKSLLASNPQCVDDKGIWLKSCATGNENEQFAELVLNMNNVSKKTASNVVNQIVGRTRGKEKASIGSEGLNACEGKPYKPQQISFTRREFGAPDSHAIHKAQHALEHGPTEMSFGPVKCGKHFKKFLVQIDQYEKETCCSNKITKYNEDKALVAAEGDFFCKGFYGIPYVAEVGIKGGVQVEAGLGGKIGLDEKTCETKGCIYGKGAIRPYLALYAEVLAGLASLEGGVRWEPFVTAAYCMPKGEHGYTTVDLTPNSIYLYYTASMGWGMTSKSGNEKIYASKTVINIYNNHH